jgi:hypothetical protein
MGKSIKEIRSFLRECINIFVTKGQKNNILNDSDYNNKLDTAITYVLTTSEYNPKSREYSDVNYSELANYAIKKFSANKNEPEWNIISRQSKLYFLPSEDAIEKYEIEGDGFNSDYEINFSSPSSPSSPISVSDLFNKGGKRRSKRRTYKKQIYKRRVTKRRKSSFRKGRAKK